MSILDATAHDPRRGGPSFSLADRLYRLAWGITWTLLARWTPPPFKPWRRLLLRLFGARMGEGSDVRSTATVWSPRNLTMGRHSTIGLGAHCYSMAPIELGEFVVVSQRAHLCAGTHDTETQAMQLYARPIRIGSNAWIAAEAFVGPGVTIGEGAVLGARGVAVRDVEPWAVYAGYPAEPPDLTVVILTYNEARHIGRAIASVGGIARAVVVIDSFSTDATVAVAEQAGAVVLAHPFVNQAKQFQWGINNAAIDTAWIMRLDADEIVEPDLAAEIAAKLPRLPADVAGVNLHRKHIFMDRWIRHGGRYPLTMLRLWRRGQGRIENRWMDEHLVVWGGRTVSFAGGFADHNLNDLTFFTDKHNKYATREAIDVLNRKYALFAADGAIAAEASSTQVSAKRWIKEVVYNRAPFWAGPLGYFLYRYFIQRGFLDGRAGLIYHFLQGFWYRFLVAAKVVEFERELAGCTDRATRLALLSRLTGQKLGDLDSTTSAQQGGAGQARSAPPDEPRRHDVATQQRAV